MNISSVVSGVPLLNKARTNYLVRAYQSAYFNPAADTLELSPEIKLKRQSEAVLSKFHKFNIKDYKSLSKVEKSVLRATDTFVKDAAEQSLKVGMKVKEHLDKRYGEGNYVFCSIGTSMSGVARVLEFSGVETKYLPISALKHYYENDEYKKFSGKFPAYGRFLQEQGLTRDIVSSSDKQYLFYDYTLSGRSLNVFRRIMQEYFGIEGENVHFSSADYECYSASAKNIDPEQYAIDYVKKYMLDEKIADFCGVAHLPIWEIGMIDDCKSYENNNAKRFNFYIIDELNRRGLLKYNPKNKTSL